MALLGSALQITEMACLVLQGLEAREPAGDAKGYVKMLGSPQALQITAMACLVLQGPEAREPADRRQGLREDGGLRVRQEDRAGLQEPDAVRHA